MHRLRARLGVALIATLLLAGCGASSGEPTVVTLSELVWEQERFEGEIVVAEGVVHTFDDPRHYWIEDAQVNRVEVVPAERIEDHVGDTVQVTGRFTFRDDEGRRILVDDLEVVTETSGEVALGAGTVP